MFRCLQLCAFALLLGLTGAAAEPQLKLKRLRPSLASLTRGERGTVDRAVALIRKGEHTAALAQLTELTRDNPNNSAVRVVLAYALLQAGNLAGAFQHATQAEAAPDHNSYVCLFLARVAWLVGDTEACRRELGHVRAAGTDRGDADALERQLARNAGSK
jgi:predicted Zn-dependent protease